MGDRLLFADRTHAVELRGFPCWVVPALQSEWCVGLSAGPPLAGNGRGPVVVLQTSARDRLNGGGHDGAFAVRCRDGNLVAVRRAVRVDLASPVVVVEHLRGADSPGQDAALLAQTKVAVLRCLASSGVVALHAAGFEVGGERVMCVGRTNSGKSTLATLALRQGGRVISDDSVLMWREAGDLHIAPLRRDVFLRAATGAILPPAWWRFATQDGPGGRLRLARKAAPAAFIGRLAPRTLMLCRIDRRRARSRVRRIAQGDALAGVILATSAAYLAREFPDLHRATWAVLRHLVSRVESFQVDLGRDVLSAPDEAWHDLQWGLGSQAG